MKPLTERMAALLDKIAKGAVTCIGLQKDPDVTYFRSPLRQLAQRGLVKVTAEAVTLTELGMDYLDGVLEGEL